MKMTEEERAVASFTLDKLVHVAKREREVDVAAEIDKVSLVWLERVLLVAVRRLSAQQSATQADTRRLLRR